MTDLLPTGSERFLLGRCILDANLLFADDVEQVWSQPTAFKALVTWRLCIDAIVELIGGRHGIQASFIQACVMQTDGLKSAPIWLEEISEYLVSNTLARLYWTALISDAHYPHRCPHCSAAAYVGFLQVECKARCSASTPR